MPGSTTSEPLDGLSAWLALWRTPGIGPSLFYRLLDRFGNPTAVFSASAQELRDVGLSEGSINDLLDPNGCGIEADLEWANQPHRHIIPVTDPLYPPYLKEIAQPPPLLYVAGDPRLLRTPQLAIVGSRNPTAGGIDNARAFAAHLGRAGLTITSGLALGIDGSCHAATLEAGLPTIAVAAHGLDRIYPARHRNMAQQITAVGALVSEFPIGTAPKAVNFPRRNRIISGLSWGTLVVEATVRSGSLITARYAAEQGREVFAVPGSIHNPLARGCHKLIRHGAKLVETAEDILEELPGLAVNPALDSVDPLADAPVLELDEDYRKVLDALGFDPTPIDLIMERSGLTAEAVSSMLLILELHGFAALDGHGLYTRLKAGI